MNSKLPIYSMNEYFCGLGPVDANQYSRSKRGDWVVPAFIGEANEGIANFRRWLFVRDFRSLDWRREARAPAYR
jgi:hypothetical protein